MSWVAQNGQPPASPSFSQFVGGNNQNAPPGFPPKQWLAMTPRERRVAWGNYQPTGQGPATVRQSAEDRGEGLGRVPGTNWWNTGHGPTGLPTSVPMHGPMAPPSGAVGDPSQGTAWKPNSGNWGMQQPVTPNAQVSMRSSQPAQTSPQNVPPRMPAMPGTNAPPISTMPNGNSIDPKMNAPTTPPPAPQQTAPRMFPSQPAPQPSGGGMQNLPGGQVDTSITPQNVYSQPQIRAAQNVAAANAVPAAADLRQAVGQPGFSNSSPAYQTRMGAMAGQQAAQGAANMAQMGNQMGWANSQNLLAGQNARAQEGLGWAGLGNQAMGQNLGFQNQLQGNLLGFLQGQYRRAM